MVVLLLFIHCLTVVAPIVRGDLVLGFCFYLAVLCVLSSFAIISQGKRELVALLVLCSGCHVAVVVLPRGTMGWSLVCDCGISWSYPLTFEYMYIHEYSLNFRIVLITPFLILWRFCREFQIQIFAFAICILWCESSIAGAHAVNLSALAGHLSSADFNIYNPINGEKKVLLANIRDN